LRQAVLRGEASPQQDKNERSITRLDEAKKKSRAKAKALQASRQMRAQDTQFSFKSLHTGATLADSERTSLPYASMHSVGDSCDPTPTHEPQATALLNDSMDLQALETQEYRFSETRLGDDVASPIESSSFEPHSPQLYPSDTVEEAVYAANLMERASKQRKAQERARRWRERKTQQ
jgi:hypothetical protein